MIKAMVFNFLSFLRFYEWDFFKYKCFFFKNNILFGFTNLLILTNITLMVQMKNICSVKFNIWLISLLINSQFPYHHRPLYLAFA
jgi:hypothetical protein